MSSWMRVTQAAPCSKCGKSDWCSVSRDGGWSICRRVNDGAGRAKVDRAGGEYWVYPLREATTAPVAWAPAPTAARTQAPSSALDTIYSNILAVLTLSASDRRDLRARGLSESEIDAGGYRTLGPYDRRRALVRAVKLFGEAACLEIPGVILRRENRDSYVCLAGSPGLLVPVRNVAGQIVALKLRRRTEGGARYLYLSSVAAGGPGPGAPVHIPLHAGTPYRTVRVTEGELKADVATALGDVLTISIAGVGTWRRALPILRELGARTCRLAFDADVLTNPVVANALQSLAEQLAREGLGVELETWDPRHKGIDDALAAGAAISLTKGTAALDECRRIRRGTAVEPAAG